MNFFLYPAGNCFEEEGFVLMNTCQIYENVNPTA